MRIEQDFGAQFIAFLKEIWVQGTLGKHDYIYLCVWCRRCQSFQDCGKNRATCSGRPAG